MNNLPAPLPAGATPHSGKSNFRTARKIYPVYANGRTGKPIEANKLVAKHGVTMPELHEWDVIGAFPAEAE